MKKHLKMLCIFVLSVSLAAGTAIGAYAAPAAEGYNADITWPDMFGDQDGILTMYPDSQEWEITFENPYGAYLLAGTYAEDGSMEITEDAGMGQFLPLEEIFAAASEQILALDTEGAQEAAPADAGSYDMSITWPDMFGDQDGILTLIPDTQEWQINFENPYGAYLIAGTYSEDGSMEITDDAGMGTFLPLEDIFAAAGEQILNFQAGSADLVAQDAGEAEEEETAADDFEAFKTIVTWDVLDFPMVFTQIPDAYNFYDTPNKGTDMFIHYTTEVYEDGVTYDKFARVYLPYGYDPEDTETKYNVLYLQHGNNCSPSNFFDLTTPTADFRTLMDNLFDPEHGLMDPFIIVCPTYYLDIDDYDITVPDGAIAGDGRYDGIPAKYHEEVIKDLIPAVESQLNVYCDDFSEEGIKATRDHRAWAGYSRGSACTWYMFHNDFEYFRYWMPTSAQCMAEGISMDDPAMAWDDESAYQYLKETVEAYPDLPFFIIAQSGAANDATAMRTQMSYIIDQDGPFSYGMNPEKNNFYYTCSDFQHVQLYIPYYLYTARDILFK